MNRVLILISYRCFDPNSKRYSGEFFQNNETLSKIFKVSQKQINTILQRLLSNDWISIKNQGSPHRKIKLTDKTKELMYCETESIINNPEILLGTIGTSNSNQNFPPLGTIGNSYSNQNFPPLGTIGNSYSNQNFTHKRTRKEPIKKLSKMEREDFKNFQIVASEGPEFIKAIEESGLMETVKNLIRLAGPNPEKETTSILKHFGKLNSGNDWNTQDKFITRFEGYLEKQHYQNRPKNETVTISRFRRQQISDFI
jgi:hypothetical protein